MTNRLFIALEIPEDALDKMLLVRDEIYGTPNNVKWEPKNKLHITIKFLGDVGENMTELIKTQLDKIIFDKFTLSFSHFGIFNKNNAPKILWAGLNGNKLLTELHKKIEDNIELLGYQKEKRKFTPHITLLRLKGNEDLTKINNYKNYLLPEIKFEIKKILLLKSILKPSGSEYSVVKSFNLI